jgi:hypothetical protein
MRNTKKGKAVSIADGRVECTTPTYGSTESACWIGTHSPIDEGSEFYVDFIFLPWEFLCSSEESGELSSAYSRLASGGRKGSTDSNIRHGDQLESINYCCCYARMPVCCWPADPRTD